MAQKIVRKRARRKKVDVFNLFNIALMIVLSFICFYPLIHVIFASFSDPVSLAVHRGFLLRPLDPTLDGYRMVLQNRNLLTGIMNQFIYVAASTALAVFMTLLAAYITSRKSWMWSKSMTVLIMVNMFFGGGLIPFYLLIRDLGLYDTRWAIILPGSLTVFNMIVLRTAIVAVPDAMEESARIDGANDLIILFRIIAPVIYAAIAVQVLFYAVTAWNAWFNATILLRDSSLKPLQVMLRELLILNSNENLYGANFDDAVMLFRLRELTKYCVIVVGTLPITVLYPFLQKYFIKGVMIGSVKG